MAPASGQRGRSQNPSTAPRARSQSTASIGTRTSGSAPRSASRTPVTKTQNIGQSDTATARQIILRTITAYLTVAAIVVYFCYFGLSSIWTTIPSEVPALRLASAIEYDGLRFDPGVYQSPSSNTLLSRLTIGAVMSRTKLHLTDFEHELVLRRIRRVQHIISRGNCDRSISIFTSLQGYHKDLIGKVTLACQQCQNATKIHEHVSEEWRGKNESLYTNILNKLHVPWGTKKSTTMQLVREVRLEGEELSNIGSDLLSVCGLLNATRDKHKSFSRQLDEIQNELHAKRVLEGSTGYRHDDGQRLLTMFEDAIVMLSEHKSGLRRWLRRPG